MKAIMLLAFAALPLTGCSTSQPMATETEACDLVKVSVSERSPEARSQIATCDHIAESDSPPGYYVMALHSNRECDGICSTNMGWFAVQQSTGDVFDWDVAELKVGRRLGRSHGVRESRSVG